MRTARLVTLAAGATLLALGCDDKKPAPPVAASSATAKPSAAAPASADAKKPAFDALVAQSKPLAPQPKTAEVGKTKLTAELCTGEGVSFLYKSNMDVLRSVAVAGDKLYVIDSEGAMYGFTIAAGDGCKLTVDASFGEGGKLKPKRELRTLSSDTKGNVVASHGIFANYLLKDGKVDYECSAPGQGYVQLHPTGGWGLGSFANATVRKITYGATECKSEPWVLQDLGQDDKRKGPFANVNTIGFMGDMVLVGGVLVEKVENRRPTVVVAFDKTGEEKFRFGNTDKAARDDNFGWIHAIDVCTPGLCVLDSNFRRMTIWSKAGKYIGNVKLSDLFDLRYPWIPDMASAGKGVYYFVAGQDRGPKSGVAEGLIYRVSGL